jgi:hypothetical protein
MLDSRVQLNMKVIHQIEKLLQISQPQPEVFKRVAANVNILEQPDGAPMLQVKHVTPRRFLSGRGVVVLHTTEMGEALNATGTICSGIDSNFTGNLVVGYLSLVGEAYTLHTLLFFI